MTEIALILWVVIVVVQNYFLEKRVDKLSDLLHKETMDRLDGEIRLGEVQYSILAHLTKDVRERE